MTGLRHFHPSCNPNGLELGSKPDPIRTAPLRHAVPHQRSRHTHNNACPYNHPKMDKWNRIFIRAASQNDTIVCTKDFFRAHMTFSSAPCSPSIASAPSPLLLLSTAANICLLTICDDRAIRPFSGLPISIAISITGTASIQLSCQLLTYCDCWSLDLLCRHHYHRRYLSKVHLSIVLMLWLSFEQMGFVQQHVTRRFILFSYPAMLLCLFYYLVRIQLSLSLTITSSNSMTCVKREYGSRRYGSMSSSFVVGTALILGGLICDRFGYLHRLSFRHDWQRMEPWSDWEMNATNIVPSMVERATASDMPKARS